MDSVSPDPGIREDQVTNAVSFLSHPKVKHFEHRGDQRECQWPASNRIAACATTRTLAASMHPPAQQQQQQIRTLHCAV